MNKKCEKCNKNLHHHTIAAGLKICKNCRLNSRARCISCNKILHYHTVLKNIDMCVECRDEDFKKDISCISCGKVLPKRTISNGFEECNNCRKLKKYYCSNCGGETTGRSDLCRSCSASKSKQHIVEHNKNIRLDIIKQLLTGQEFVDYLICPICSKVKQQLTRHMMTKHKYMNAIHIRKDYPNIILECSNVKDKVKNHGVFCSLCPAPIHKGNKNGICEKCRKNTIKVKSRYPYNGYNMRSSYEVKRAIFLDSKNIIWTYEEIKYDLLTCKYIPDFHIYDENNNLIRIEEVKCEYTLNKSREKISKFVELYPEQSQIYHIVFGEYLDRDLDEYYKERAIKIKENIYKDEV